MKDLFPPAERERLLRVLAEKKPRSAFLFGSRSKKAAGPKSDVDLLIIDERAGSGGKIELEVSFALFPRSWHLDIIGYSPEDAKRELEKGNEFLESALTEGVLLYGQQPVL